MAKKEFKAGLYGVAAAVLVAVVLIGLTVFAFTSRYNAFSPEKVAQSYADTIVQNGDGYNALKVSLVSKEQKFGSFVTNAYMTPYINDGKDVKQNEIIGTGSDEEAQLLDTVYNEMYDYFLELQSTVGLQNYDSFYSQYFAKLKQVRKDVIGDDYMDTDFMFGVFESNVQSYGNSLTGTQEKLAADEKTVLQEKTIGEYQKMFGEDYKFTTTVTDVKELDDSDVKAYAEEYKSRIAPLASSGETKANSFGLEDTDKKNTPKTDMINAFNNLDVSDNFKAVDEVSVEVTLDDGTVVAKTTVYVVKIGNSWYVDNSNTDTAPLYILQNR